MSEAEKKSVTTILRSLVNSLKDASLNDLARDFSQIEGCAIPFRKFGFANLPDFLLSTGQFYVTPYQTVIAKTTAESAHISKLVAEQNPGKKKKVKRVIQPQRRLLPSTVRYPPQQSAMMMGPKRPFQNYNPYNWYQHKNGQPRPSAPPLVPPRRNIPSVTFTFADLTSTKSTASSNSQPANNPTIPAKTAQLPPKLVPAKLPGTALVKPNSSKTPVVNKVHEKLFTNPPSPPITVVAKAPNVRPAQPVPVVTFNTQDSTVGTNSQIQQPIELRKNLSRIHSRLIVQPNPNITLPPTAVVKPEPIVSINIQSNAPAPSNVPSYPTVPYNPAIPPPALPSANAPASPLSSIHSRLVVRSEVLGANPVKSVIIKQESSTETKESRPDAVTELARYAKQRGWSTPKYKFLAASMSCKIEVRITLNGTVYSSQPRTFETALEGKRTMARDLLANFLKMNEKFTNEKILERLHEWLKLSPNGMFIQNIPELFLQKQNLSLPADWISMVKKMTHKFSITISFGNIEILYAENPNNHITEDLQKAFSAMTIIENETPIANTMNDNNTSDNESVVNIERSLSVPSLDVSNCDRMDKLVLPWADKSWNVTITNAKSTVEVWARLIGTEYSNKLDDLLVDIEMDIMHEKIRPKSLTVGNIYLAVSVYTYRVRIERTDFVHSQCLCFCVDSGVEEWYSTDQLFECRPEFIKFPAQAICLSLFGLSDCAGHPNAAFCLEDALTDQSLIADILCLQEDYETQLTNPNQIACIKTILYDTSSSIDVQLNDVLLNEICANSVAPALAEGYLNGVTIAHISDIGDIYCHLTSQLEGMQFLQSRVARLFSTTRAPTQMMTISGDITSNELYLVQDTIDGQWYRAGVLEQVGKLFKVFFVDVGKTQIVDKTDIYCLNSFVLGKFPYQAIVFRLGDVGVTDPQMVAQLRDYLRTGSEAMVKVLPTFDRVPKAKVFMRFQNGPLICVNDSINLEAEIKMYSTPVIDKKPVITENTNPTAKPPTHPAPSNVETQLLPLTKSEAPAIGELFKVTVTMVCSPHNFKVQPRRHRHAFEQMMEALQVYVKHTPQFIEPKDLQIGQPYACKRDNNMWCRAVLHKAINESMFVITFCDFGDVDVVKGNSLKILPSAFRVLPELAITARLTGIAPVRPEWQAEDCILFRRLVEDRSFVSHVDRITSIGPLGDEVQVDIRLIDISSGVDIDISKVLLQKNIAIKSEY